MYLMIKDFAGNSLMKHIILFVILTFISGCAPLSRHEKALETTWQVANVADFAITERILSQGGEEKNPLIGSDPSDLELAGWTVGTGVLHYWVTTQCPEKWRPYWQWGTLVLKVGVVGHNVTVRW